MRLKKGDLVKVLSGKDRGKQGKILRAFPKDSKVMVEGVNLVKKHRKPRGQKQPGGIIEIIKPVNVSSVQLICPETKVPSRVRLVRKEGKKQRVVIKSGVVING